MRRLIRPETINGKIRLLSLIFYLSSSTIILAQNKPSTAVSRTLQTQSFPTDVKTTLKASINALPTNFENTENVRLVRRR